MKQELKIHTLFIIMQFGLRIKNTHSIYFKRSKASKKLYMCPQNTKMRLTRKKIQHELEKQYRIWIN